MAEGFITRRGGVGAAERTAVPTINFIEKDDSSITVTFKNNDTEEATIFYGLTTPPDSDSVVLATDTTSGNITFSGLDDDTPYTIFAYALVTDPVSKKIKSEIVSIQVTTDELPPDPFFDISGSPGPQLPINDLNGNPMRDEDKGIAYYGTVPHTDLFTSTELSTITGISAGVMVNDQQVWHKYWWNGGIHFWRNPVRRTLLWPSIANAGAALGTGTTISRKGFGNRTTVNQTAETTKNNVNYIIRLMEHYSTEPVNFNAGDGVLTTPTQNFNSEYSLILMNLHASTNSGLYAGATTVAGTSTTDGVTYANWSDTLNYVNNDFVGWKTNFGDTDLGSGGVAGHWKWSQEQTNTSVSRPQRGVGRMSSSSVISDGGASGSAIIGWSPVLTVKHPSFATYGKTGGFNQNQANF
jgi:hypothetical protein